MRGKARVGDVLSLLVERTSLGTKGQEIDALVRNLINDKGFRDILLQEKPWIPMFIMKQIGIFLADWVFLYEQS